MRFVFVLCGILSLWTTTLSAQCTQTAELTALRGSLHAAMHCGQRQLRYGAGVACSPVAPPTCAGSLVDDVTGIAFGNAAADSGLDPSAAGDAYRCQRSLARAVEAYVARRLYYLVKGFDAVTAETKASAVFERLTRRCTVQVIEAGGRPVPAVGPQCASAVGEAGNHVDAEALRGCLQTLLRRWTDRYGPRPQPLRPNIILILTDDQRWDTTDATHAPAGQLIMPKLHAELGDSGVRFLNAFMTTPLCCPSRSSILTGKYSHTTGVHSNAGDHGGAHVFDDAVSIGTLLQAAGYRTGFYGKYLNGYDKLWTAAQRPYVPPGWSEWHAFKAPKYFDYTLVRNGTGYDHVEQSYGSAPADYSTDVLRELAKQFVESSAATRQPFFLYLAPKAPHLPRQPAPRHDDKFASLPKWRPASYNEPPLLVADMPQWVGNTARLSAAKRDDLDETRRRQLEMLQAVDELIGGSQTFAIEGIMQTLRRLGIADDTLVVFFADNGYLWGEHRQTAKNKPFEEAIRAPMFVRYPPLAPLKRTEEKLALNIDLCPTFAALAGAPTPADFDGRSLERVLDGTEHSWRSDSATEGWALGREWVSVREAQWKYSETTDSRSLPLPTIETELYDVVSDPLEQNNVANLPQQSERVARMAARLRAYRPAWPQDATGDPEDDDE